MSRVAIIGAGAAGLMLAGLICDKNETVVFERNEKAGKKLYITGKGRCNLTNLCAQDEFFDNVVRGQKFLRSAISSFSSFDCVNYFESLGLKTKVERGNRVFPQSDKSSDVIKVLLKKCEGADFRFNSFVEKIERCGDKFKVITKNSNEIFDKVVVATGGKSYSSTGSDGFGYEIAKSFGHNIEPLRPALCAIKLKDTFVKNLQGVSLKNVQLNIVADTKKINLFGEMLFTESGISGPIVLTASSLINRAKNVKMTLDFKPALSEKQLDARLLREFDANKNKDLKNILRELLPKAVAEIFAKHLSIDENMKANSITKAVRNQIIEGLKQFPLDFAGLYDVDTGIITSGGVALNEINPKTFESKLVPGLYFVGEILDCDALTGGFNLQIAWATGFACAKNFN